MRWPEELMGRNSVTAWTRDSTTAWRGVTVRKLLWACQGWLETDGGRPIVYTSRQPGPGSGGQQPEAVDSSDTGQPARSSTPHEDPSRHRRRRIHRLQLRAL